MPSVAINPAPKMEKTSQPESNEPMKNVLTIIEKKVRNLEKRKAKLDGYRQESASGKTLNEDQKAAVARYEEVLQSLEMARDLSKQFAQLAVDVERSEKKRKKKELLEKQQAEIARLREVLLYQDLLNCMGLANIREDFLAGSNGALTLAEEDLAKLDAFYPLVSVNRNADSDFTERLSAAAEHLQFLLDGRSKEVAGTSYREVRELLQKIASCGYFEQKSQPAEPEVSQEETVPEPEVPPQEETAPEPEVPVLGNGDVAPEHAEVPLAPAPQSVPFVPQPNTFLPVDVGTDFNFLQDSIIDSQPGLPLVPPASVPLGVVPTLPSAVPSSVSMVSMDPAVVMVHPQVPPHLGFPFLPGGAGGPSLYGPPLVPMPSMMSADLPHEEEQPPVKADQSHSPAEAPQPLLGQPQEDADKVGAWADEETNETEVHEGPRDDSTWTNAGGRTADHHAEHQNRRGGYRGRGNPRGRGGNGGPGHFHPRGGYGGSGDRDRDRSYQGGPQGQYRGGGGGRGGPRGNYRGRGGPRGGPRGGYNERPERH